jgi:hypothetical protein
MQYLDDDRLVDLRPYNKEQLIKTFISNLSKEITEDIELAHPRIERTEFYKLYGVKPEIRIICSIDFGKQSSSPDQLLCLTDILYICCELYSKMPGEKSAAVITGPIKHYFSNHRHLLLTITQSTWYIKYLNKGIEEFSRKNPALRLGLIIEKFGLELINPVAKLMYMAITSCLGKYKKYYLDKLKSMDDYETIKNLDFYLYSGHNTNSVNLTERQGSLEIPFSMSFAYEEIWAERDNVLIFKSKGLPEDFIMIDDIVYKLFEEDNIPKEYEFIAVGPITFGYTKINTAAIKYEAVRDKYLISDEELGPANIDNFHEFLTRVREYLPLSKNDKLFYKSFWDNITEESNGPIADNLFINMLVEFIEISRKLSGCVDYHIDTNLVVEKIVQINERNPSSYDDEYITKMKKLLVETYFMGYINDDGNVRLLKSSSAKVYSLIMLKK